MLHYFHQRSLALPEERLIFRWDRGMELGVGDRALLEQLAYELGFPIEGRLGLYLTGESLRRAFQLAVMTEDVEKVMTRGPTKSCFEVPVVPVVPVGPLPAGSWASPSRAAWGCTSQVSPCAWSLCWQL